MPTESGKARTTRARGLRIQQRSIATGGWTSLLGLANSYETREKITAPYSESGWIHACLKPIGQGVGSRKLQFWVGDPKKDKNAQLVPDTHPIVALFARPNPLQTMSQFFEAGVMHRKLDGEDFWVLIDLLGKPVAFDVAKLTGELPAFIMCVRGAAMHPKLNQLGFPVAWTFRNAAGLLVECPPSAVIQFKDYDPDDPVRGLGDVEACLSDIDLEWQATRYQRAILKHAGDPGGHIMVDAPLAPDEAEATENEANEKLQIDNAGRWTVVAGKGIKYEANKLSPRDMQFKELQMWLRDKIAGILGVPLPIIGVLDQATYSNMEQCVELFWKGGNGLCSYLSSVEDVVNSLFLPRLSDPLASKMVARFDLSDIEALQEDEGLKLERASKLAAMNIGVSLDEAMQLMGCRRDVSKMPYSGTRLVAGTLVPIESVAGPDGTGLPEGDPNAQPGALPGAGAPVQDTALNGAQISSLLEIVAAVSAGTLTPDGAVALILAAFPAIDEAEAKKIVDGAIDKPPEPAPVAPPASDTPPAPAADDSGKQLEPEGEALTREQPPSKRDAAEEAFAERRDYWAKHEKATLEPGEATLKKAYLGKKGWRRKYEAAQLARIRAFAETGKGAKPEQRSDEIGTPDPPPRHVTEAEIEKLLLDRSEWAQKMQSAFDPHVRSIFNLALQDMADELEVDMLSTTDPRVVKFLTNQLISLAQDHTGTLADKVRRVLLEELTKAPSTGDLQSAVAEILPELTDALKLSFSDRESRALTIARTETAKASNGARFMQMADAGVEESEWVTSGDAAVRGTPGGPYEDSEFSHYEIDGKTAPIGQEIDHEKHPGLKYPSDPDGQPGDTINCFPAGTPVLTARGDVPIEQVRTGDRVWTHRNRWRPVIERHINRSGSALLRVELEGGRTFRITPAHKLFVVGKGWVAAGALQSGDELLDQVALAAIHDAVREVEHPHPELREVEVAERSQLALPSEHLDGGSEARQEQIDVVMNGLSVGRSGSVTPAAETRHVPLRLALDAARLDPSADGNFSRARLDPVMVEALEGREVLAGGLSGLLASRVGVTPLHGNGSAASPDLDAEALHDLPQRAGLNELKLAHQVSEGGPLNRVASAQEPAQGLAGALLPHGESGDGAVLGLAGTRAEVLDAHQVWPHGDSNSALPAGDRRSHVSDHPTVVSVCQESGLHDVFNLGVREDMSYFAAGVLGRNCRCASRAKRKD